MDIIKRWLKLKKAQRVRNPWAVASHLNQGKHTGNSGTSKGAYVAGINRNEWNSPEGMEAASERSAEYHGMSPKRKKGHKYSAAKKQNENKPLTAKQRAATPKATAEKTEAKKTTPAKTESKKSKRTTTPKPKTEEPRKATTDAVLNEFGQGGRYNTDVEKFVKNNSKKPINKLAGYETAKPAKRKQYDKIFREGNAAASDLSSTKFDDKKAFKSLLEPIVELFNLRNELSVKKSLSSSRRLLNLLKETVTVDNDQLEKDFTSALNQAMKKHKEDFSVPTGNNEILKDVKSKEGYQAKQNLDRVSELTDMTHDLIDDEDELASWMQDKISEMDHHAEAIYGKLKYDKKRGMKKSKNVKKIMDLPNFTKVKNAPQLKKAGVTDALIAMLAGYKLTPKVNPGEMTPAQQRQWERTLQNQMRRKNIDIDKAAFKQLQNFYKDKSDTYTRRKPAKNGVKVEKILTSPPFQGAEFDPVSHRWKKPGEVAAKTGQINVGTGGKRRIRGAGTGAAQRSVGGHARGIRREERRGVTARAARQKGAKKTGAQRAARIKAYKKLTKR